MIPIFHRLLKDLYLIASVAVFFLETELIIFIGSPAIHLFFIPGESVIGSSCQIIDIDGQLDYFIFIVFINGARSAVFFHFIAHIFAPKIHSISGDSIGMQRTRDNLNRQSNHLMALLFEWDLYGC
jgi:hypothetical protein